MMKTKHCRHCGHVSGAAPRGRQAPPGVCPECRTPYQEMYPRPLPRREPAQPSPLSWVHVGVLFAAMLAGGIWLTCSVWPSQHQAAAKNEEELKAIAGVVLPDAIQPAGELCGAQAFAGGAFCRWAPELAKVGRRAALARDCMEVTSVRLHPGSKTPERPDFAVSCRNAAGELMQMGVNEDDLN